MEDSSITTRERIPGERADRDGSEAFDRAYSLRYSSEEEEPLSLMYDTDESAASKRLASPLTILTAPSDEPLIEVCPDDGDDTGRARLQSVPSGDAVNLNSAFDDALLSKQAETPPPHRDSSKKPARDSWSVANLAPPISMRRVSSTPTNPTRHRGLRLPSQPTHQLHQRTQTPTLQRRNSGTGSRHARKISSPVASQSTPNILSKSYNLRRQISLPTTNRDRSPCIEDYVDSVSSTEEEIAELVPKGWATPKRKKERRNIFRSVGLPSQSRLGDVAALPSQATENAEKSIKPASIPEIEHVDTGKTDEDDIIESAVGMEYIDDLANDRPTTRRRAPTPLVIPMLVEEASVEASTRELEPLIQRRGVQYVVHLTTFACFGTIIRVFMGRIFGSDCEFQDVQDWLTPLSRHVCVTASGLTQQTGGALFTDLPANMFGSFLMGISNGLAGPPLPWLAANHPLQQHTVLHVAIKTGMCGSLTTFASWNSQMVMMLDGSKAELGSQVATILFGYMMGMMAAIASFQFGSHCAAFLNRWRYPAHSNPDGESFHRGIDRSLGRRQSERNDIDEEAAARNKAGEEPPPIIMFPQLGVSQSGVYQRCKSLINGRTIAFVLLAAFMACFFVGDFLFDIPFYRNLWMEVLFTPPGAMLRWILAIKFNVMGGRPGFEWVPWGTLAANILGSCLALIVLGIDYRYLGSDKWVQAVSMGIRVGFTGSLTTVSSFAKEVVDLTNFYSYSAKGYLYGSITILAAMLLGLACFSPIVR